MIGGLFIAHRSRPTQPLLQGLALAFGALLGAVALAPTLTVAAILIVAMGAASVGFIATANATLQLSSEPRMRGRVMALYAMAFLGTTPIGAPTVGLIAEWTSPRGALLAGSLATLLAAGLLRWRHGARLRAADQEPSAELAARLGTAAAGEIESSLA